MHLNANLQQLSVDRELFGVALHNSTRSVPLQLVAAAYVVFLGMEAGRGAAAAATGALAIAVALLRLWTARRFRATKRLTADSLWSAVRSLELNAALAGAMWAASTLGIYPALSEGPAVAYLLLVCGSLAVAAFFMSLASNAFTILAATQLGTLAIVLVMG